MRERPILFSAPMVRAILAGEKTQTRRIIKPQPSFPEGREDLAQYMSAAWDAGFVDVKCPYGQPGDRLWVRETFAVSIHDPDCAFTPSLADRDAWDDLVIYRADNESGGEWTYEDGNGARVSIPTPWRPSIHMPRWASRLTLEVTSVRVERLQDISGEDARAEGVKYPVSENGCPPGKVSPLFAVDLLERAASWGIFSAGKNRPATREATHDDMSRLYFSQFWESINGAGSWDRNDWVWVVSFRRVDQLKDAQSVEGGE